MRLSAAGGGQVAAATFSFWRASGRAGFPARAAADVEEAGQLARQQPVVAGGQPAQAGSVRATRSRVVSSTATTSAAKGTNVRSAGPAGGPAAARSGRRRARPSPTRPRAPAAGRPRRRRRDGREVPEAGGAQQAPHLQLAGETAQDADEQAAPQQQPRQDRRPTAVTARRGRVRDQAATKSASSASTRSTRTASGGGDRRARAGEGATIGGDLRGGQRTAQAPHRRSLPKIQVGLRGRLGRRGGAARKPPASRGPRRRRYRCLRVLLLWRDRGIYPTVRRGDRPLRRWGRHRPPAIQSVYNRTGPAKFGWVLLSRR